MIYRHTAACRVLAGGLGWGSVPRLSAGALRGILRGGLFFDVLRVRKRLTVLAGWWGRSALRFFIFIKY
jgi:hypothetical protein